MTVDRPAEIRLRKVLGQNLKTYRKSYGLTQAELAEKVGVTQQYIGFLENEYRTPSLQMLIGISKALEIEIPVLFKGSVDQRRSL
jgi:transcriptional regulator with XRE-family HTH domain